MLSHQEPSFGETPNKTTIFVVEFREKNGVPRSAEPFSETEVRLFTTSPQTLKRQRISNENLAQFLEILHFGHSARD